MDFDLRKANARTFLPVASLGFSCLWGFLLLSLLGVLAPEPGYGAGTEAGVPRVAFLAGACLMMLAAYAKRDLISTEEGPLPSVAAAVAAALLGLVELAGWAIGPVALTLRAAAWAVAGAGFAFAFLEWPKAFMVGWRRDVGVFLALGALLGAALFLFADNLAEPYRSIAAMGLPAASMALHRYIVTHTVMGARPEKEPSESTKLFALTGFTVLLFGLVFGMAFFLACASDSPFAVPLAALAVAVGFGAHIALGLLVKRYIPFSNAEKASLLLCGIGFVAMVVAGPESFAACGIALLAVWAYLDLANLSSLVGFASGHESPFWRIARGQLVLIAGMALSWGACLAVAAWQPDLIASLPYVGLGIVLVIAFIAIVVPFQDNAFADKNSDGAVDAGGAFMQRCAKVASEYRLSGREGEVLRYLAKGRNAQFISEELCISAYTVKTHIYHIYQKLGVNSQQELITIVDSVDAEFQ